MLQTMTVAGFFGQFARVLDDCVIWDVRDAERYALGYIQGAINKPVDEITKEDLVAIERLAILCGGGTKAVRAIEKVQGFGYDGQLFHLIDGTRGAEASGFELVVAG